MTLVVLKTPILLHWKVDLTVCFDAGNDEIVQ